MKLIPNWKDVFKNSAAIRVAILGILIEVAQMALPLLPYGWEVNPWVNRALIVFILGGTIYARLVAQTRIVSQT